MRGYLYLIFFILLLSAPSFAEDLFAVKVNGETFALSEFQKIYDPIRSQILSDRKIDPRSPQGLQLLVSAKENVLEEIIRYQVLTQAAKRMKIAVTEQEINSRIEEVKKNFPSQLAFESSLYEEGINPNDLRQGVTTKILEEKIADLLVGKIVVTPKEVKQYLDKIKKYFVAGQDTAPVTLKPEHVKNFLLAEKKRSIFERWYEETLNATEIEIGSELFSAEEKEIKNKNTRLLPGFS
jgi:parvulin-like peptidyl-prolyl isomerase